MHSTESFSLDGENLRKFESSTGAPHRLEPHRDANIPDSLSASNLENRRKLLPQLEIVVLDLKNNVVRSGVT